MPELCFLTARELRAALGRREVSAREVLAAHLDQIERLNPAVNAVITLAVEQATAAATTADELAASGADLPVLHGLPVAHKDLHETAGLLTTYGSPVRANYVPAQDALVIERMRQAGVITIGKTNVPEFGAGSHTFNPLFGATRNPYDRSKSAGGSSGGTAAALACGMHPIGDGSDMGGSLRNPASFNNVVGFRPSPGRVPGWPALLGWGTMGVSGPMARTVADTALLLSVQAGPDPRSPIALETPGSVFAEPLESDPRGLRVAFPGPGRRDPGRARSGRAVDDAAQVFAAPGRRDHRGQPGPGRGRGGVPHPAGLAVRGHVRRAGGAVAGGVQGHAAGQHRQGRALSGDDLARAEELHMALFQRVRSSSPATTSLLLLVSQVLPFDVDLEYPTRSTGYR